MDCLERDSGSKQGRNRIRAERTLLNRVLYFYVVVDRKIIKWYIMGNKTNNHKSTKRKGVSSMANIIALGILGVQAVIMCKVIKNYRKQHCKKG